MAELARPGRDPREQFEAVVFSPEIRTIDKLVPGMKMTGIVTNVTNFGAFVDIGVHQDGLVHISALSETFVKDPRDVVKTGQVVQVKVMEVDLPRNRISLSMRLTDEANKENVNKLNKAAKQHKQKENKGKDSRRKPARQSKPTPKAAAPINSAMADAFANLKLK